MKTTLVKQLVTLILLCTHASLWALDGFALSGGANLNENTPKLDFLQIGARDSFDGRWLESDAGAIATYWDAGVSYWNQQRQKNWVVMLGVAARYEFSRQASGAPFIEYGWGGAYFPHLQVSDQRHFSTHFQFVNRLEAGYRFGSMLEHELGLAYWHYSNGHIKTPNPGADFLTLRYTRRL